MSKVVANTADPRSDWTWVTLADVGKVITGNTPPTSDAENYGAAIPFVKPTELVDRAIRSAPSGLATQAIGKARVVPAGAVLVSCIGNLGKTGIAKVPVAFNQQINAVVFNENVLPEFGFYYAQTLKPWLYGESSATTIPIVNKGKFQQARFPLAPMAEQREIVAEIEKQFSRLDEAVANIQRVKANLKRYKASVLKAAVEGRLVETEASIAQREGRSYETGEQLLQHILEDRQAKWAGNGILPIGAIATRSLAYVRSLKSEATDLLSQLAAVFVDKDGLLMAQASVPIYAIAFKAMFDAGRQDKFSRTRLLKFQELRQLNRIAAEKAIAKADYELLEFDRMSQQGTNDASSIKERSRILVERLTGKL